MAHVEDRWLVPPPDGSGRRVRGPRYGHGQRWRAIWEEADGARRQKAFATKDEAQAHLDEIRASQRAGTYVSPAASAARFRDVAERWFAAHLAVRESTRAQQRTRLDQQVLPALGNLPCSAVDRAAVQGAVAAWSATLAPNTVRNALGVVKLVCELAIDEKRMTVNPCQRVNVPRSDQQPVEPLTTDHVQRLVDHADPRWQPMIVLAAATGLRPAELRALTWDRIVETSGGAVLRIDRQLTTKTTATKPAWGPVKTTASVRSVSIGTQTLAALGERGTGLVFTTQTGGPITHRHAARIWRGTASAAELATNGGWHQLRHHHASVLIAAGSSPRAVADRLGHADPAITLRVYAHLWATDDTKMRDATDGLVRISARQRLHVAG